MRLLRCVLVMVGVCFMFYWLSDDGASAVSLWSRGPLRSWDTSITYWTGQPLERKEFVLYQKVMIKTNIQEAMLTGAMMRTCPSPVEDAGLFVLRQILIVSFSTITPQSLYLLCDDR